LILSRARSAAHSASKTRVNALTGGQGPLTGSTDRKNSLSVAINALLCLLSIGRADQPKIIML
jgi:hypothetical protein